MYTVKVPYVDYKKNPRTESVSFNLDSREVFKLMPELVAVNKWLQDNRDAKEERILDPEEVKSFYSALEHIMLEAYGEVSEDGKYFRKAGRYEFEESAMFNACMMLFVKDPKEATNLVEGLFPEELFEMAKNATPEQLEAADKIKIAEKDAEIERLRAMVERKDNA